MSLNGFVQHSFPLWMSGCILLAMNTMFFQLGKALQNEAMTLSSDTPGEQIFAKKKANKKEKRLSVS